MAGEADQGYSRRCWRCWDGLCVQYCPTGTVYDKGINLSVRSVTVE